MRDGQISNRHSREGGNPLAFDGHKMDPPLHGHDASFVEAVTHFGNPQWMRLV
jgi:hypothetical protein